MHKWFTQRAHQRRLAVGLLTLAFGCFAQALWIEAKAGLVQAFSDPSSTSLTLVACYLPEASQDGVTSR